MHALPFVLGTVCAAALASPLLHALSASGRVKPNYRQREVVFPFGVLSVLGALLALAPLALLQRFEVAGVLHPETLIVAVYVLGVAFLGLVDDALGGEPRGWRGHGRAVLRMQLSTGALKAAGSLGLALFAMSYAGTLDGPLASGKRGARARHERLQPARPAPRPGHEGVRAARRSGLAIGSAHVRPLWALGLFVGPALVAGAYDLRERAMLGDTGANLLGALAGLWLVLSLSAHRTG